MSRFFFCLYILIYYASKKENKKIDKKVELEKMDNNDNNFRLIPEKNDMTPTVINRLYQVGKKYNPNYKKVLSAMILDLSIRHFLRFELLDNDIELILNDNSNILELPKDEQAIYNVLKRAIDTENMKKNVLVEEKKNSISLKELQEYAIDDRESFYNVLKYNDNVIQDKYCDKTENIKTSSIINIFKNKNAAKSDLVSIEKLKQYLDEYITIPDDNARDIELWEKYLVYSIILGNTETVIENLKILYPNALEVGKLLLDNENVKDGFLNIISIDWDLFYKLDKELQEIYDKTLLGI